MRCPTLDDLTTATLAMLPRGRAWQTNDGGPWPGRDVAFAPAAFQDTAFATTREQPSALWQYWRSFAAVMQYLTERLCDLRLEFWCQSVNETRAEWMFEYGLPDDCDAFPDLCTKVAAIGGTRCEYYAMIAARMGWSIECSETLVDCGSRVGSFAGHARAGAILNRAQLKVIVHLNDSTGFSTGRSLPSLSGRFRAGRRQACGPNLSPLKCLISRIVHAEIQIVYEAHND